MGRRKPGIEAAYRKLKAGGRTAADVWANVKASIERAAREDDWRPSEVAMAMAVQQMAIAKVYGKRATKGLFQ